MKQKAGMISLGCAKNRVDSERIMGLLKEGGFDITPDAEDADVLFINTCGFIDSAKAESINTILEMADYKERRCKKLIVTGCLAQRYREDLKAKLPEVDRFIPIDDYAKMPEILKEEIGLGDVHPNPERYLSTDPWAGYLKIADGCYNICAYCAIPLIKGKYASEPFEKMVEEAKMMAKRGVKEITLIAQDTTMYGVDLYHKKRLGELVKEIDKIEGIEWIRVLYLYPSQMDEELLKELKECRKFVPYFDLPMQYGNDKILKAMNRATTVEKFKKIVAKIREYFPDAIFRTTMIVGFPGETEEDFNELMSFVREMKFDRLGAFAYSREEGTKAYDMKPQVHWKTKERRLKALLEAQEPISEECAKKFIGKEIDVILEGIDEATGMYEGRSYASAPDDIDGSVYVGSYKEHKFGEIVKVRIHHADIYDLYGNITEEEE